MVLCETQNYEKGVKSKIIRTFMKQKTTGRRDCVKIVSEVPKHGEKGSDQNGTL